MHNKVAGRGGPSQWRSGLSVAETTLNTHIHKGKAPLWERIISTSGWIKSGVAPLAGMHSCPTGVYSRLCIWFAIIRHWSLFMTHHSWRFILEEPYLEHTVHVTVSAYLELKHSSIITKLCSAWNKWKSLLIIKVAKLLIHDFYQAWKFCWFQNNKLLKATNLSGWFSVCFSFQNWRLESENTQSVVIWTTLYQILASLFCLL